MKVRLRGLLIGLATPTNHHPRQSDPGERGDKNPIHWHLPLGIAFNRNHGAPCERAPDRAATGQKRRRPTVLSTATAIRVADLSLARLEGGGHKGGNSRLEGRKTEQSKVFYRTDVALPGRR